MTESKNKDSLMKLLLSSGPSSSLGSHGTPTSSVESPLSDQGEDSCPMLSSYLNQINVAGQNISQPWDKVHFDHNYARSGSDSFYHSHVRPTKTLFMTKTISTTPNLDDVVDVTGEIYYPTPPYDVNKAQEAMEECEKCVNTFSSEENEPEDWEDAIPRTGWTTSQSALFNKVLKILHSDRMARLANSGDKNEPVLRRLTIDKSAQRFRETMAGVMWDVRLTQWLHSILTEHLTASYLVAYLEILQTLKNKIKTLIEKMVANNTQLTSKSAVGPEILNHLLKQPWDPTVPSLTQHKLRKLPGNPIIILVPAGIKRNHITSRMQIWNNHLSNLGTLINLSSSLAHLGTKLSAQSYLAQMITTTKGKLAEVRVEYPRRPIILIGWRAGAALACQVAVTEVVTAVVCLGFSANTAEGTRGEPDDSILDVQCPVLFVAGENAASSRQEDLEEMREKMRVQTGLLVVGNADDCLRMGKTKKRLEGVTQSVVDRCILEEIGDFLAGVLTTPKPLLNSNELRRGAFARRRHNSTTSSVDSESSTAKRSRPGTPQSQTPLNSTAASKTLTHLNGNLKAGGTRTATRGRRPNNIKKSIMMNSAFHSNMGSQVNTSNGGITVNIGSLASLGPLGSLRMGPNAQGSTSSNFLSTSQATSKTPSSLIDAAPPEEVMPIGRDNSESRENKAVTSPEIQSTIKSIKQLIATPSKSCNQNQLSKSSTSPTSRTSLFSKANPIQSADVSVSEEKKHQQLPRHILASTSRMSSMSRAGRGGTTLQLMEKQMPPKINKPMIHNRSPTAPGSTVLNNPVAPRPQVRTMPRAPTIIKTSPNPSPKTTPPANRAQKFSLAQSSSKFMTSGGPNIILLESSTGQNRPVIVPFSGSTTKISTQLKTTPQKITKSSSTTKTSPVTKFSMSKKIISTSSILQQRPLLFRNRTSASVSGKTVKGENQETTSSQGDLVEIPVFYAKNEEKEDPECSTEQQEDQPVVIPIIDSSKLKNAKKSYPKDISYTEDGDSISFPLDCEIDGNEDESGLKVLIGSLNRVAKTPQIFVTKSPSNVNIKKLKSFVQTKKETQESQEEQQEKESQLISKEEPKYFINYTDENEEGVLYEIVEDN